MRNDPVFLALLAALLLPLAAAAQQDRHERTQRHGAMVRERQVQAASEAEMPMRAAIRSEMHGPMHGRGRMSPEERQQLRRDIHDAGRDLYSARERPPRP